MTDETNSVSATIRFLMNWAAAEWAESGGCGMSSLIALKP